MMVREVQVNVNSIKLSELDIVGRVTCLKLLRGQAEFRHEIVIVSHAFHLTFI